MYPEIIRKYRYIMKSTPVYDIFRAIFLLVLMMKKYFSAQTWKKFIFEIAWSSI